MYWVFPIKNIVIIVGLINPLDGKPITNVYKEGDTWSNKFPKISSAMEECRADSVAMYLGKDLFRNVQNTWFWLLHKVSLLGVVALWGDCTFIPADWGSYIVADLCYVALFEDFSFSL